MVSVSCLNPDGYIMCVHKPLGREVVARNAYAWDVRNTVIVILDFISGLICLAHLYRFVPHGIKLPVLSKPIRGIFCL